MIVQGSGLQSCVQAKSKSSTPAKGQNRATEKLQYQEKDIVELTDVGLERSELLKKIRQKIQSGFYNTDSVLEDISHGFAKALDSQ